MKAKPIKITKLDKLDNFGNTTFVIEFDEGTKGFYTSKNPDQNKFVVGNVADFEIEQKQGSKGPYNKITIPQMGFKPGIGGGKPAVEPRIQMISFSMSYSKDLVVAGKVDYKDIGNAFEKIYSLMISKI
jgi:hypothetical protein